MDLDTSSVRRSLDEGNSQDPIKDEESDFEPSSTSINAENTNHTKLKETKSSDSLQETNTASIASPVDELQSFGMDESKAMEEEIDHDDHLVEEKNNEEEEHELDESNDFDDFGEFGEVEMETPVTTFEGEHWLENFEASLHAVFGPPKDPEHLPESPLDLERILSLWDKLIEMPVLQRPDWLRSSIRHIFLVSMGLPVDLDELLPSQSNPSSSSASFKNILKISTSSTQLENEPSFNYTVARRLCCTTHEILASRSSDALVKHINMLKQYVSEATALAQYWTDKRDSSFNDKLLYETVVDDLVQHSKRLRKSAR
ncbi:uncharacterized protein SOCG_04822 [Schizosaccharomyces octosporus yFS286]|uniref:Fungal protein n=1 Tax=Schizosaccharomyces octosporus (strain yFS286) TaxID=483514 RepID=S9RDJ5_SCHOY|nr:uncharacterized protein SOCG_04822 [Schizosaccharomyces octosporus yFS286]EPX72129.1 fungal protein [Schizosaccharomyces octosporus yFS286]